MSGSANARDALHKVARAVYTPTHAAGAAYAKAQQELLTATDVVAAMGNTLALIIAAERLTDMATEAVKSLRSVLAEQIAETGADDVVTMHHKAHMARDAAWVSVDQPDLVPKQYAKETHDKRAIKADMDKGIDVPGCILVVPNSSHLVIRNRK